MLLKAVQENRLLTEKDFYEIARGSAVEIDTAIGIAFKLSYVTIEQLSNFENLIISNYKILSGLIGK